MSRTNPVAGLRIIQQPSHDHLQRVGRRGLQPGGQPANQTRQRSNTQEFVMKKLLLAAVAALSLGMGVAYAHPSVVNHNGQVIWGPDYPADSGIAGG
jgi:hypothetical protein